MIADVPLPWRRPVKVVVPVPPFVAVRALAKVSAPAVEKLDVAVPPKEAVLNAAELTNAKVVVEYERADREVMSLFAPDAAAARLLRADAADVAPVPPLATARVPLMLERVEVATHVGTPLESAKTYPDVVDAMRASVAGPLAYKMSPAV